MRSLVRIPIENLGPSLRSMRVLNKKTQDDMCFDLGCSKRILQKVEAGTHVPSLNMLKRYSELIHSFTIVF